MQLSIRVLALILILILTACSSPFPAAQQTETIPPNTPSAVSPTQANPDPVSTQPSAEVSGLKVAFILNGEVWFWSEATPARQLTDSGGNIGWLKLSDDGTVIAYTVQSSSGPVLWAMNNDGSNARPLVDVTAFTGRNFLAQLEFQPNTHIVYFSTLDSVQGQFGVDLHRVDAGAQTPAPQTVIQEGSGQFTFSPDGRLITLAGTDRISILHIDSPGLIVSLEFPRVNTHADWSYYPQVIWLDDSSGFYTVIPGVEPGEKARFLYVSENVLLAQLAEFNIADLRISQPVIAPNGSKVAYMTATEDAFDIHVIDASTADMVIGTYPLSPQYGLWAWSPDSDRFTYWTEDPSRLLIAGVNNPPVPLLDLAAPYSLTWVDANRFLYIANGELRLGQAGNPILAVITSGYWPTQDGTPYDFAP